MGAPVSVLIDPPAWSAHGRSWSHLVSDASYEELHAFAARLGVPRRAFEGDHYDVPADLHAAAVAAGAQPVPTRELLQRLRAAGLRRPKRRGEKVLTTGAGAAGARADVLVASRVPAPRGTCRAVLLDPAGAALRTDAGRGGAEDPGAGAGGADAGGAALDLPAVPWPAAPVVLGFRRTWTLHGREHRVLHEGVVHLPPPVAGAPLPGTAWTPLEELPARWWMPLLVAAGVLPASRG